MYKFQQHGIPFYVPANHDPTEEQVVNLGTLDTKSCQKDYNRVYPAF